MTNDEIRKNDKTRMPKNTEQPFARRFVLWVFGFLSSFVIRYSDFGHGPPVNVERAFAKSDEDDLLH